jgi:hypothetical protein
MKPALLATILVLGVAATALTAQAQPTAPTPPANTDKAAKAKPVKEKRICEEIQKTGSKIPRMTCKTVSQIEEEQYFGQKIRDQFRNEGAIEYPSPNKN